MLFSKNSDNSSEDASCQMIIFFNFFETNSFLFHIFAFPLKFRNPFKLEQ